LPLFPVEEGASIAQHDPADKGDEQQHDQADKIEPGGQREIAVANRRTGAGSLQVENDTGENRNQDRTKGSELGNADRLTGTKTGPFEGIERGTGKQQRCEKRQHMDHVMSPVWAAAWEEAAAISRTCYQRRDHNKNSLFL
jgi:hypothetical protein